MIDVEESWEGRKGEDGRGGGRSEQAEQQQSAWRGNRKRWKNAYLEAFSLILRKQCLEARKIWSCSSRRRELLESVFEGFSFQSREREKNKRLSEVEFRLNLKDPESQSEVAWKNSRRWKNERRRVVEQSWDVQGWDWKVLRTELTKSKIEDFQYSKKGEMRWKWRKKDERRKIWKETSQKQRVWQKWKKGLQESESTKRFSNSTKALQTS